MLKKTKENGLKIKKNKNTKKNLLKISFIYPFIKFSYSAFLKMRIFMKK